ncbi:uncharacterized protein [Argopecten irradians]|uniref:uncharacterized protein n=1 Tax=Argopecten irradians TaxID=31199 RepID=UPI00371C66AB
MMLSMILCGLLCIVATSSEFQSTTNAPIFWDRGNLYYDVNSNIGYPMLNNSTAYFRQEPKEAFYPQWHVSSETGLPDYMTSKCNKPKSHDVYTLTVLHGATWTSKLPLPAGNFSVSVDICISSSASDIKSYIQLMEGPDSHKLNYTKPSGAWETLTVHHTSEDEWNVVIKAHILWGDDVLALDNLIVRCSGDC